MSGAAQYVGKDERRRHRAILDLDLNRTKRYKVSRCSMAGETNEADDDDETDGRTDDEPRAEDVPRGAGISAIDECQVTTKVVEEYEPAQSGPLLQVVRDRSDHLSPETREPGRSWTRSDRVQRRCRAKNERNLGC